MRLCHEESEDSAEILAVLRNQTLYTRLMTLRARPIWAGKRPTKLGTPDAKDKAVEETLRNSGILSMA